MDVYAGDFYLGSAVLGNPWTLTCDRSPDGQYLAIVDEPDVYPFAAMPITWLRLGPPLERHIPLSPGSMTGNDFAFSPDGRYLAYFGCGGNDGNCGVYITDLQTQINRKLATPTLADWFAWSPDNHFLAYYAADAANQPSLFVVEVRTASVVHAGKVEWKRLGDTWQAIIPEDFSGE